jgi:N-acetylglucosamine-6-phosphate deacetylase
VVLVTDAVAAVAGTVGPVALIAGETEGSAARLTDGTLAGSALTMDRAVRNVVTHAGIGIELAVEAASTTPARLLGLDDRGAISSGKRADLVALRRCVIGAHDAPGLWVESVWVGGRSSWPR